MNIDAIKLILKIIAIAIGIICYAGVWISLVINWDKCIRTGYGYPCFEKFLGGFYCFWIAVHMVALAFLFIWAWN